MIEGGGSSFCLIVCLHGDLLKDEISGEMSPEVKGLLSVAEVGIVLTANSVLFLPIRILQWDRCRFCRHRNDLKNFFGSVGRCFYFILGK